MSVDLNRTTKYNKKTCGIWYKNEQTTIVQAISSVLREAVSKFATCTVAKIVRIKTTDSNTTRNKIIHANLNDPFDHLPHVTTAQYVEQISVEAGCCSSKAKDSNLLKVNRIVLNT